MNIVELLKKIENKEIEQGAMFCGGDLFYNLILIERDLYFINDVNKTLQPLTSRTIGHLIVKDYKLYEYKRVID